MIGGQGYFMEKGGSSSAPPRVVVVSGDLTPDGLGLPGEAFECARVGGAYEAAAELLCAPAVALVIDLGLLSARHVALPAIARRLGVEMIGVGSLPAGLSSADLDGLRLVAPAALAGTLRRLIETAPRRSAAAAVSQPTEAKTEPPRPAQKPAAPVQLAPARKPPRKRAESPGPDGQWHPEPRSAPLAETVAEKPQRLLTQQELDALLEDEP